MKVRVKKGSDSFGKFVKQLGQIDKQKVQVGHFGSQGFHYSGYTYVELLQKYHFGLIPGQPAKRILAALYFKMFDLNTTEIKSIRRKFLRGELPARQTLREMAIHIAREEYSLFGKVGQDMPAEGDSKRTPLYETGELRDKTAFRTSMDGDVEEVNNV